MKDVNQKLMRSAGFKRLHDSAPDYTTWGRGAIRVVLSKSGKQVALKKLVGYIINQVIFRAQNAVSINYGEVETGN